MGQPNEQSGTVPQSMKVPSAPKIAAPTPIRPVNVDRLFAHLGRLAFEAAEAALALERSESVRARLETAADARNTERNDMVRTIRDLRERCDEYNVASAMHAERCALYEQDEAALSRRLGVATAEIKQLRSELANMTAARDKAITERDRAVFAAQGIE